MQPVVSRHLESLCSTFLSYLFIPFCSWTSPSLTHWPPRAQRQRVSLSAPLIMMGKGWCNAPSWGVSSEMSSLLKGKLSWACLGVLTSDLEGHGFTHYWGKSVLITLVWAFTAQIHKHTVLLQSSEHNACCVLLIFKCLHGFAPTYLINIVSTPDHSDHTTEEYLSVQSVTQHKSLSNTHTHTLTCSIGTKWHSWFSPTMSVTL